MSICERAVYRCVRCGDQVELDPYPPAERIEQVLSNLHWCRKCWREVTVDKEDP